MSLERISTNYYRKKVCGEFPRTQIKYFSGPILFSIAERMKQVIRECRNIYTCTILGHLRATLGIAVGGQSC